jgi:transposase
VHRPFGPSLRGRPKEELQRENQRLRKENEQLRQRVEEAGRQLEETQKKIEEAHKKIEESEKKIAELERQLAGLKKDSTNSSKPPSSDAPWAERRSQREPKPGGRKPGGQWGHPGRHRELLPVEQVSQVVPVLPECCGQCGQELPQQLDQVRTVGPVHRYQTTEMPRVQPIITEYQCHKVVCPTCQQATRAEIPAEVQQSQFGPRLAALIAYLTVVQRVPRRGVEELLETVLGIALSLGTTQKLWEESSQALEPTYQQLEQQLPQEPVLNVDETGWFNRGQLRWLWALVARHFVFFTVASQRSSQVLIHLLGTVFAGILCSDRFRVYLKYHAGTAQWCWAHLKRDLLGLQALSRQNAADRFCRDALALMARLFRLWHRFRGGGLDRPTLLEKSLPLQKRFRRLCQDSSHSSHPQVRRLAKTLFRYHDRLFVFLSTPGVEPTNNAAERALRPAVQWRKICFGNQSQTGEIATARLLTITRTCALQQRNTLEFLATAIGCYRAGQPAPLLLPQ